MRNRTNKGKMPRRVFGKCLVFNKYCHLLILYIYLTLTPVLACFLSPMPTLHFLSFKLTLWYEFRKMAEQGHGQAEEKPRLGVLPVPIINGHRQQDPSSLPFCFHRESGEGCMHPLKSFSQQSHTHSCQEGTEFSRKRKGQFLKAP